MNTHQIFLLFRAVAIMLLVSVSAYSQQPKPQALAPVLIGPYDGSDVSENHIVWTWFMQPLASNSEEIICDLKVVEMLDGQTPEEALRVNPLVILKENLKSSAWQTNFAARNFLPGHRYAWRVIAKVRQPKTRQEIVVSESEIWTYTYNLPVADARESSGSDTVSAPPSREPESSTASGPKVLEFTGRSRFTMEHNDAIGLLTQSPKNLARWQIEPTIKFYGVPFGLNLLVTTEENTRQSDVSRGAFGSQNTKKGLNLVLQQQVEDKITELEQVRDSEGVDSLRIFAGADSIAVVNRINALYELEDKDLSENMETLKELGLVSQEQELIAQFPALGFGRVAPSFSRFLLNGVTINGGLVEYNPGNFYAAGAMGKVQREIDAGQLSADVLQRDSTLLTNLQLFKNVYSARIGYGRRNGNNIIATVLHADDDDQSMFIQGVIQSPVIDTNRAIIQVRIVSLSGDTLRDPDDPTRILTKDSVITSTSSRQNLSVARQQNTLLGLASHLVLDSLNVVVDGEFNVSYFKDFKNKLWIDSLPRTGIRSAATLGRLLKPSEFEQVDFTYAVRSTWQFMENTGRLSGGMRYVGGGYQSVGVAGLRKDIFRADGFYNQTFFDRQLRVNAGYSMEEFGYKRSAVADSLLSTINSILGGAELRLRGLPVVSVNYSRHGQSFTLERDSVVVDSANNDAIIKVNDKSRNAITQYVLTASHIYGDASVRMLSFVSYMNQVGDVERSIDNGVFTTDSVSPNRFRSNTFQLSQRVGLGELLNVGCLGSYTTTYASERDSSQVWSIDVSVLVNPVPWLPLTVGFIKTRNEQDGNATTGWYCSAQAQPSENVTLDFRLDSRDFSSDREAIVAPVGFTGLTARLITNIRW